MYSLNRIKKAAAHCAASADAVSLEFDGIVVAEIVCGEGEADDVFALNGDDSSAEASLFVYRQFERGRDAERVELAVSSFEQGFGFGEFFDGDAACVERGCGHERAGAGDAEADEVSGDVEAFASKGEHMAVVVSGEAEAQACAACREDDDALSPRDAAQELDTEPRCAVQGG